MVCSHIVVYGDFIYILGKQSIGIFNVEAYRYMDFSKHFSSFACIQ